MSDAGTAQRQGGILRAAARLIARQGIAETNVRQIAREAGMSSGTLHYYFPSKDELIDALILKAVTPLHRQAWEIVQSEGHPREQLAKLVRQTFELFFAKMKQFRRVATRYEKLKATFTGFLNLVFAFIKVRAIVNTA